MYLVFYDNSFLISFNIATNASVISSPVGWINRGGSKKPYAPLSRNSNV